MSANADVLQGSQILGSSSSAEVSAKTVVLSPCDWDPQNFAREQIRGLVRRVFFDSATAVRQVVFSAADPRTEIGGICEQVGQTLALETHADIVIVDRKLAPEESVSSGQNGETTALKSLATQKAANLWHVPEPRPLDAEDRVTSHQWLSYSRRLRSEFEFVIIHGPAAGTSSEAALLAQLSDGIILVLDAHSTRRATARKIKENLEGAQSRILGTVLYRRAFPVPERIYRLL